jgi:hypothetical protein
MAYQSGRQSHGYLTGVPLEPTRLERFMSPGLLVGVRTDDVAKAYLVDVSAATDIALR